MDTEALENLGLTSNEAEVFIMLSRTGPMSAGNLTKKVNLHRSRVYEALDRLLKKGVVSYTIINKVKHFQAKNPASLLELLDEYREKVEEIIPTLQQLQTEQDPQVVEGYVGVSGVKSLLKETLKVERYDVLGAPRVSVDIMGAHFWQNYNQKAKEKKVYTRMIFNEELREFSKIISSINRYTKVKFLRRQFDNLTETFILNDCVMIVIWTLLPTGVVIRDKHTAKAYKQFFEVLWKGAKQ